MRLLWLLFPVMAGCVAAKPVVRPIQTASTGSATVSAAPMSAAEPEGVPARLRCDSEPSREDRLLEGMVRERLRAGSPHAALAELERLDSRQAWVALLRADILRALDDARAGDWYRALRGSCLDGEAEHGLGLIAARRQDYGQAAVHLARAVRVLPTRHDLRNDQGFVLMHLGQDAAAGFALRTAAELAPDDASPQWNLALLSLLKADAAAWKAWQQRLQPAAEARQDLWQACQSMMRHRRPAQPGCPLDPRKDA